jgi:hypothetical protein
MHEAAGDYQTESAPIAGDLAGAGSAKSMTG